MHTPADDDRAYEDRVHDDMAPDAHSVDGMGWEDQTGGLEVIGANVDEERPRGRRRRRVERRATDVPSDLHDELYDDEAAIQAHLRTPHYRHMDEVSARWVESKTVRRYVRAGG